jgi:phosphate transport system substrate-binding protein
VAGAATTLTATAGAAGTLSGAGSTLVAPLEAEWAQGFQSKTGNVVNYAVVGSGTGIKDIQGNLVDFGASDAPLTPTQLAGCSGCVQIPWALSAVGVGYNLPGVSKLKLTGRVISRIYLGQITNWDDPQIAALNKGKHLPNLAITPVHRSDGSGTTYAFTNYLSDINSQFKSQVGYATSVNFPTGVGGNGNAGVTAVLQSTQGAIAYAEVAYLISHQLPAAAVKNKAGKYEYPNLPNIENAAQTVHHVPSSNEMHIVDPPSKAKIAYPISTFTYAIVHQGATQAALLKQWILYAMGPGQAFGPALDFAQIPKVVLNAGKATVARALG